MLKKELSNVLEFVKERGSVYESEIWNKFLENDSIDDRARVTLIIEALDYKGLIEQGYINERNVVRYVGLEYQ